MADEYRGVVGALPYAFRRSDSRLFKSYVLVAGLAVALVVVLVTTGLIVLIADTAAARGGTLTVSRAFYVLVGLALVGPLLTPPLLVARGRRRGAIADGRYERRLAAAGYLFLGSIYLALVISAPPELRSSPSGALAPLVERLYALPPESALVAPLLCAGLVAAAHYASTR